MTEQISELLDKLRAIYGDLNPAHKEIFSEVANTLKNLDTQVQALQAAADNPLPEAPASATAKVVNPETQAEWLVTVREVNAGKLLIGGLPDVEKELLRQGYIAMDDYIDQRRAERQNGTQARQPVQQTPGAPPVQSNGTKTFAASELSISVNDGKPYFKIKGGKFTKYGVIIWPEVLEAAGYDVNALDPMQTYNLNGWQAIYSTKEDGKPEKVVELRREQ